MIGLIVYNYCFKQWDENLAQVKRYVECFKQLKIEVEIISNIETEKFLDKYHDDVSFCLFLDKDIALAKYIETLGVKVFNDIRSIQYCDDKSHIYYQLKKHMVETPITYAFPLTFDSNYLSIKDELIKEINQKGIHYPFVVKECFGSFGEQVYLVEDFGSFGDILINTRGKKLIAQQFIEYSSGKDIRVNVIGSKVHSAIERHNPSDFRSNLTRGGTAKIVQISDEIAELAVAASKACKCIFSGVDVVLDENNKAYVIEVNSNLRTLSSERVGVKDLTLNICEYIIKRI